MHFRTLSANLIETGSQLEIMLAFPGYAAMIGGMAKHFVVVVKWEEDFPWVGSATHRDCIAVFASDKDALIFCDEQSNKYVYEIEVWEGSNKIATLDGYSWSGRKTI